MKKVNVPCDFGCSCQNQTRYRALANLASDWFWELDAELCFVFHDGLPESLFGLHSTQLIGAQYVDIARKNLPNSEELNIYCNALLTRHSSDVTVPILGVGKQRFVRMLANPQFDENGHFEGYVGCARDVTMHVMLQKKMTYLATHDDLTGICNRREFESRLHELVNQPKEVEEQYCLCFIDLDRFKQVNDTAGHPAGDQLLRELVEVMRRHICTNETLARLGGDEFGLLLLSDVVKAKQVANAIVDSISRYDFCWENRHFSVGASIGIATIDQLSDERSMSVEDIIFNADNACYAAKKNGRNQIFVSNNSVLEHHEVFDHHSCIKSALSDSQFKLLMQPILCCVEKESHSRFEVLLRLDCGHGQLLEPNEFMPLAERFDLMYELDFWVVENALIALNEFHLHGEDVALSINLSPNSLSNGRVLDRIASIVNELCVPEQRICFDFSETTALRNVEAVSLFMKRLKCVGVEFALDDFGSGLSSFTYLQQLQVDYLKIDGMLTRKIMRCPVSKNITASINDLSHKLGVRTVAESVEDQLTAQSVRDIGVDFMQGFGVANLIEMEKFLESVSAGVSVRELYSQ